MIQLEQQAYRLISILVSAPDSLAFLSHSSSFFETHLHGGKEKKRGQGREMEGLG